MNPSVDKIEKVLRSTVGILDVKWLDQEERKQAFELEETVRKEGLAGSGGYVNQGVIDVLSRKYVCVVLNNNEFRHATAPSLFWMVGDVVIGEEVTDDQRLQKILGQRNVKVLRKNFVLYFDRMKETRGQAPVFVICGLPFPEIENIGGILDVISASPTGSADIFFKKRFGWDTRASDLGTILIGYNLN